MKKILIAIIFIALFGFEGLAQQKKLKDLVGVWEFVGENAGACLEIVDSNNIVLTYNGEKKKIIKYKIDFQKTPIWFDFSTTDTTSIINIKSLLEVMNDSMLKWQLFIDEDRTAFFSSSKGELYYLRKAKPIIATASVNN
jgi:regulatory protein YycH of two-component signal transduction system YycFG